MWRLLSAVALICGAIALIVSMGLPQRADYTGRFVAEIGYVAPEIGAFAPPFRATTLTNTILSLSQLHGQTIVLNFWATWCAPCRAEMPILQALYDDYADNGVTVVAINVGEDPRLVNAWANQLALTYPILLDKNLMIATQYAIRGQPTTYIVAPDGKITHIFFGAMTADQLEAVIKRDS
jgi:thiol-disulfide isomerase/thioredoxin